MAEISGSTPEKSYTFFEAMIKAITSPSQATYRSLAQNPKASAGTGFLWLGGAAAVSSLISILLVQIFKFNPLLDFFNQYDGGYWAMQMRSNVFTTIISLICAVPIGAIVAVVVFAIVVGLLHLVASLLGGSGNYGQLVYMLALISVPTTFISAILAPIPYIGCLTFLLSIYVLVLEVLAIDAVYQFGIAKAALTLLVPVILLCCLVICVVAGLATFFAAAFQETFQNFPQQFPMP